VSAIEQVQLGFRQVAEKRVRAGFGEERIVLAPGNQRARPVFAEIRLPPRIQRYVRLVVGEEIQLDVVLPFRSRNS
jgi:hypothetical protein